MINKIGHHRFQLTLGHLPMPNRVRSFRNDVPEPFHDGFNVVDTVMDKEYLPIAI